MPGLIKVSGSQRTIASPYVKVNGAWRNVAVAYTKVNGTWRQWYAANIQDDFNRADAASLGTVSNGVTSWTPVSGSWAITANQATSATAPSTYPLAQVTSPLQTSDYELRLDIPSGHGPGLAFWITDANNFWDVSTNSTFSSWYTCPNGGTLSGTSCISSYSYPVDVYHPATSYTCGSYITPSAVSYGPALTPVTSANGCGCTDSVERLCCSNSGGSCSGGVCYVTTMQSSCDGNVGRNGTGCSYQPSSYCTAGSWNGSSCVCTTSAYWTCSGGETPSNGQCSGTTSQPATYNTSTSYNVRVQKRSAGVVTEMASWNQAWPIRSLSVVTSNSTINVTAYSNTGLSGFNSASSYTATTPTLTPNAGIIITSSSYDQGNVVDNFYLK